MFLKDLVLPKHIDDFIINKNSVLQIKKLFSLDFLSNLYIYGPSGCGKYSLFIKNLENIVNQKIEVFPKNISLNNQWSTIKEATIQSSEFHFEINLSKYANNKNSLFSLIDAITESKEINSILPYKIILIRNIHTANKDFVKFIKQKSEQLIENTRFIIIGKTNSNNLNILNGCFFTIRMSSPNDNIIYDITKKYTKNKVKKDKLFEIFNDLNRNLSSIFTKIEMILLTNYYKNRVEIASEKICKHLLDKKISSLYEIRELLYDYQIHNENMAELLKAVLSFLTKSANLKQNKILGLTKIISEIDTSQQQSYKEIIHLEHGMFRIFKLIHLNST